jgi:hypothetical protein
MHAALGRQIDLMLSWFCSVSAASEEQQRMLLALFTLTRQGT